MAEAVSFREFARRMGVSDMAVRKAVKAGRLKESVGHFENGRVGIISAERAEQEWKATTSRTRGGETAAARPHAGKTSAAHPEQVRTAPPEGSHSGSQADEDESEAVDDYPGGEFISASTLVEAQRLATNERARKLKLDNDTRQGRLIAVERVAKDAFEAERIRREAVLNLPARIASELAAEWGLDSNKVYVRLDRALRMALNELADKFEAVGE